MNAPLILDQEDDLQYPDSDGEPMAENTKQFHYIVTIKENLDALFSSDPNVFVAGDLFWYPVKGQPGIRTAPDVLVAFGRPRGDRGSYQQWKEANIAPQVVFEIWSPENRKAELVRKLDFYDRYQVEEYYWYDPDTGELLGYRRIEGKLQSIDAMAGWVSPRLQVRFTLENEELVLFRPDGQRFHSFQDLLREVAQQRAEKESRRAEKEANRAEKEGMRADTEARRAEKEAGRAAAAEVELERLRAQLRQAGLDPERK